MATIKALEGRTVHQIQSGQVIVDLCSVVKELVENSLDAEATSIEVRFKNHGLDSIEVQDNGVGISSENYETIALKHYTSKLSSYDDLSSLKTFGFRGEALSSLCALSSFHILTAREDEAPKGTRLDFEISGRLRGTQVVASQKGTTVAVENLFMNLPVRRRELEKNIKREYGKVLGVLQAYACISTSAKVSVSNMMAKGKKAIVFATKSNLTTRENIANVYGAKTLPGLVAMNLSFEMQPSKVLIPGLSTPIDEEDKRVHVVGHVSRPIFGEGRQAPDRQMFFVNSRPCGLPQVAKVFNEIYKSFNISQSPFIFANIILNTNAYDVNVSPDKRTILLHDQNTLLESLKQSLTDLFESQDQTVPQSSRSVQRLPSFKPLIVSREASKTEALDTLAKDRSESLDGTEDGDKVASITNENPNNDRNENQDEEDLDRKTSLIENFLAQDTRERINRPATVSRDKIAGISKDKQKLVNKFGKENDFRKTGYEKRGVETGEDENGYENGEAKGKNRENEDEQSTAPDSLHNSTPIPVHDFNQRMAEQQQVGELKSPSPSSEPEQIPVIHQSRISFGATSGTVQNAFDRMRPRRAANEIATIKIGSKTTTAVLGSSFTKRRRISESPLEPGSESTDSPTQRFSSSMRAFAAPGTKLAEPIHARRQEVGTNRSDAKNLLSSSDHSEHDLSDSAIGSEDGEDDETVDDGIGYSSTKGDKLADHSDLSGDSDGEYLDEEDKKKKELAKVAALIHQAEENSAKPSQDNIKRAKEILISGLKCPTTQWTQVVQISEDQIAHQMHGLERAQLELSNLAEPAMPSSETSPEERLSLTVSKEDFSRMHIAGQFNLGFILATRSSKTQTSTPATAGDELFIIDQHASDEKYNFERLQSSTVVQDQRLVKPRTLELTAIEEEIILENNDILLKNGFEVSIDTSGDEPVGQRCKLLSLPMSREVTFDITDLEELLALLADSPHLTRAPSPTLISTSASNQSRCIPRPSKVRRMFAMRACRSSVMIGKALSRRQMERLVTHMGEIDKPWNCPHGRPTMRHVLGLGAWEGWREGDGLVGMEKDEEGRIDWRDFLRRAGGRGDEEDDEEEDHEADEEEEEDEEEEGEEEKEEEKKKTP